MMNFAEAPISCVKVLMRMLRKRNNCIMHVFLVEAAELEQTWMDGRRLWRRYSLGRAAAAAAETEFRYFTAAAAVFVILFPNGQTRSESESGLG